MANDFKQAGDRTINDVNRANRDAWDSGEFRHADASDAGRIISPAQRRQVAKAMQGGADPIAEVYAHAKANKLNRKDPGPAKAGYGHFAAEIQHSEGQDTRHPAGGGQEEARGGTVVVHHDEHQPHPGATSLVPSYGAAVQAEHEAKLKTPEGNAERLRQNAERLKKHGKDEGQLFKRPKTQKVSPTPSPEEMRASVKAAQEKRSKGAPENRAQGEAEEQYREKGFIGAHDDTQARRVHLPRTARRTWKNGTWA